MNSNNRNTQRNRFGICLELLLLNSNIKSSTVAAALNYDVSYISKWISGKALPSRKNVEKIIGVIATVVSEQTSASVYQSLMDSFGVSDPSDLHTAISTSLRDAYYEVTGEINESQYASNASLQISPRDTFPLLSDLSSTLETDKPLEIAVAADLFSLDHALKLQMAGIESNRFRFQRVRDDIQIDYIIDLDTLDRTSAYDAILLIHMMTNFSLCRFRLYHSAHARGRLLFSIKGEFSGLSILSGSHQFLCTTSTREKRSVDSAYQAIRSLPSPDDLVFLPADMENMLVTHEYFHNFLSQSCRWLVGHVTEHFIPPSLFYSLCDECFGRNSKAAQEAERAYLLCSGMLRNNQIRVMLYYLSLMDFFLSGELDFFNRKVILTPNQRHEVLIHLKSLISEMSPGSIRLVKERFSDDFKYITNPCFFLSDFAPYLRLENMQYSNDILLIKNETAKDIFSSLFELVWMADENTVISDHGEIIRKIDNMLSVFHVV